MVRFSSIRALFGFAVQNDMLVYEMDVQTAFLNGTLEEEIFMQQPEGYNYTRRRESPCMPIEPLTVLVETGTSMLEHDIQELHEIKSNSADPCVFIKKENDRIIIVAVYVDDLIILTKALQVMQHTKDMFANQFKMKDLGKLRYCVGISVQQDERNSRMWIHQKQYIASMLSQYGLSEANPVTTPMDPNVVLIKDNGKSNQVDQVQHQSMVGSLLYATTATRPDITSAVGVVTKFSLAPTTAHLTAVKRIFRYLKCTIHLGLCYVKADVHVDLIGYSDADWAGDHGLR